MCFDRGVGNFGLVDKNCVKMMLVFWFFFFFIYCFDENDALLMGAKNRYAFVFIENICTCMYLACADVQEYLKKISFMLHFFIIFHY